MNSVLLDLGYSPQLENYRIENQLLEFIPGRIISQHKEHYTVLTEQGAVRAEITGNLRFTADSVEDFPAVGDWVALSIYDDFAIIHHIFPRKSVLARTAVGKTGERQIIAVNIDFAFIVQAVDHNFNLNRIERYLALCHDASIEPIIVLTKIDLISEAELLFIKANIEERVPNVMFFAISNVTRDGYGELVNHIEKGKTYCLLGSSGVGKSTLLNQLLGKERMSTGAISDSTGKGRHVTTGRELVLLENGGVLIDNPGMREVGIVDSDRGVEQTFETILDLSSRCKFSDCTHTDETGCAVIHAVESGELDEGYYHNYLRIVREKNFFESSVLERKKREKERSKIIKHYKKIRKNKR